MKNIRIEKPEYTRTKNSRLKFSKKHADMKKNVLWRLEHSNYIFDYIANIIVSEMLDGATTSREMEFAVMMQSKKDGLIITPSAFLEVYNWLGNKDVYDRDVLDRRKINSINPKSPLFARLEKYDPTKYREARTTVAYYSSALLMVAGINAMEEAFVDATKGTAKKEPFNQKFADGVNATEAFIYHLYPAYLELTGEQIEKRINLLKPSAKDKKMFWMFMKPITEKRDDIIKLDKKHRSVKNVLKPYIKEYVMSMEVEEVVACYSVAKYYEGDKDSEKRAFQNNLGVTTNKRGGYGLNVFKTQLENRVIYELDAFYRGLREDPILNAIHESFRPQRINPVKYNALQEAYPELLTKLRND